MSQQRPVARPVDMVCTCMAQDPHELLTSFNRRWSAAARRMVAHGHPVNTPHLMQTIELVLSIDSGKAPSFAVENWSRSHHMHTCPFSGRRTPLSTVDQSPEARWVSPR